jgi:hypothetical protein
MSDEFRLRALGIKQKGGDNPLGSSRIIMYGAGAKKPGDMDRVEKGDPVELMTARDDDPEDGSWRGGFVACSGVTQGQLTGEHAGEEVVWVAKAEEWEAAQNEGRKPKVSEWPADLVRATTDEGGVPAAKNPYVGRERPKPGDRVGQPAQSAPTQQEPADNRASFSAAEFYRYDPQQKRDYHGRWTKGPQGGGGPGIGALAADTQNAATGAPKPGAQPRKPAFPRVPYVPKDERQDETGKPGYPVTRGYGSGYGTLMEDAIKGETERQMQAAREYLGTLGLDAPTIKASVHKMVQLAGAENIAADSRWYYEQHEWILSIAERYNTDPQRVAAAVAAMSPQMGWAEGEDAETKPNQNQSMTIQVLEEVLKHGDRVYEIDDDLLNFIATAGKNDGPLTTPNPNKPSERVPLDITKYNGLDAEERWRNKDLRGSRRGDDLPIDVLVHAARRAGTLKGMTDSLVNAIAAARGYDPDFALNAPKTRSFYNNLMDPWRSEDSTIDIHMIRAMTEGSPQMGIYMPDDVKAKILKSDGAYQVFHDLIAETASELNMLPHEVQAAVWVQWRCWDNPNDSARKEYCGVRKQRGAQHRDDLTDTVESVAARRRGAATKAKNAAATAGGTQ